MTRRCFFAGAAAFATVNSVIAGRDRPAVAERNRRPYSDIDWATVKEVHTSSHCHCTNQKMLDSYLKRGFEFLTLSNYYPSAPTYSEGTLRLKAAGDIVSKFYVRFLVADKPGAFGTIASILGRHGVSISAASQKDISANGNSTYVPVVALMHAAKTSELEAALAEIKSSGVVDGDPVKLRMI